MAATTAELVSLLTLDDRGTDRFVTTGQPPATKRLFGGRVLAQAMIAAGQTVDSAWRIRSVHAHFLRAGDSAGPVEFLVERQRDGRTVTTRRVAAVQRDRPIFELTASFQADEHGIESDVRAPAARSPADLPRWYNPIPTPSDFPPQDWSAFDMRFDDRRPADSLHVWLRSAEPLPDVALLHSAALAYASDLTLLAPAVLSALARDGGRPGFAIASLDHAMWFHRRTQADQWLLHEQRSMGAAGGRALCTGQVFDGAGQLIATTMQEGLVRVLR